MAHGDAVIDSDGVELFYYAADTFDLAGNKLSEVLKVHVAGNELREGIGDGDDGFAEFCVLHARGAPQPSGAGHVPSMGCCSRPICRHSFRPNNAIDTGCTEGCLVWRPPIPSGRFVHAQPAICFFGDLDLNGGVLDSELLV
jgi:hypothetical protein